MFQKITLAAGVLFMGFAAAFAADQPEFSAEMVTQTGGQTMSGKIYATQEKFRYEMAEAVTIMRLDTKISYMLMPSQQMYMQQTIDSAAIAKVGAVGQGELERVSMGKESVEGQDAEKFLVTYSDPNGTMKILQWMNAQGIPVKVASEDGAWTVFYKNINMGPQPAELFEVPAGYKPMGIPSMPGMSAAGVGTANASSTEDLIKQAEQMAKAAAEGSADPEGNRS